MNLSNQIDVSLAGKKSWRRYRITCYVGRKGATSVMNAIYTPYRTMWKAVRNSVLLIAQSKVVEAARREAHA